MKALRGRRMVAVLMAASLLFGMVSLMGPGAAGACDSVQLTLPGTAVNYNASDGGGNIDGVITNNTTQTLIPSKVRLTWAQKPGRADDECLSSGPIAPGQWVSFHLDRPDGVPVGWTPSAVGFASAATAEDAPLPLTVSFLSNPTTADDGSRAYTLQITNDNDVDVSSIDVEAIERVVGTNAFVDSLDSCNVPDTLGPGEQAVVELEGNAPSGADVTADVRVTALELPDLTLAVDTTSPSYCSGVTFSMDLTRADGSAADGCRGLELMVSADGDEWSDLRCVNASNGSATVRARLDRPEFVKAVYCGGGDLGYAESDSVFVTPTAVKDAPSTPRHVRSHHRFKVHGLIDAGANSSGKAVTLTAERKRGSRWVKSTTFKATADGSGAYSKSVELNSVGVYRIRAFRSGVGYSSYSSLKVTK